MAADSEVRDNKTTTIGVLRETAKQLKQIADHYDVPIAEALDRVAGPVILEACKLALREFQSTLGEAGA